MARLSSNSNSPNHSPSSDNNGDNNNNNDGDEHEESDKLPPPTEQYTNGNGAIETTMESTKVAPISPIATIKIEDDSDVVEEDLDFKDSIKQLSGTSDILKTASKHQEYHRIEFTPNHKRAMISLLNSCIPEVSPADSLADVNQIYWRLASLVHFFNLMFDTRGVLLIQDIHPPIPSMRHLNPTKLQAINRYLRFWLAQFYYCEEVVDTLRFEPGQLAMTTILVLNLLHCVRHSLPQLRPLFNSQWSPDLDDFSIRLHALVRFDHLNELLQFHLEHERVAHVQTRKELKTAREECGEVKDKLDKSRAHVERLKMALEQKERIQSGSGSFSGSLHSSHSHSHHHHHHPQLMKSLLSHSSSSNSGGTSSSVANVVPIPVVSSSSGSVGTSSGSGTITISTSTGSVPLSTPSNNSNQQPNIGGGGVVSQVQLGHSVLMAASPIKTALASPILLSSPSPNGGFNGGGIQMIPSDQLLLSPRRRGRPRKNPLSPLSSPPLRSHCMTTSYKPIQSKPLTISTHHPIASTAQTHSLIIPATAQGGGNSRTILQTVPIGTTHGQTHHVIQTLQGPQSILTPITTTTSANSNSMLKKLKFTPTQQHVIPQTGIATANSPPNQLILTPSPMMVQYAPTHPPTQNILLSPTLTCQPILVSTGPQSQHHPSLGSPQLLQQAPFVQTQPQTLSFTLQAVPTSSGSNSLIAAPQPTTISTQSISMAQSGPSLLMKTSNNPVATISTSTGSESKVRSNSNSLITPNSALLSNIQMQQQHQGNNSNANSKNRLIQPITSKQQPQQQQPQRNRYLMNKLYTIKYPDARRIDHANIPMYYTQKSANCVKCRLCSKRFPSMTAFQVHFQSHTDQWVFHCDWEGCGSFFLSNYKLKRHKRTHTGERPFICEHCRKSYTRADKLKEHAKICTGSSSGSLGVLGTSRDSTGSSSSSSSSAGSVVSEHLEEPSIVEEQPPENGAAEAVAISTQDDRSKSISVSNPPSPMASPSSITSTISKLPLAAFSESLGTSVLVKSLLGATSPKATSVISTQSSGIEKKMKKKRSILLRRKAYRKRTILQRGEPANVEEEDEDSEDEEKVSEKDQESVNVKIVADEDGGDQDKQEVMLFDELEQIE